jgi:hypothetical protein
MIDQTQKQPPDNNILDQKQQTVMLTPVETQVAVSVPWYKRIFYHAVRTETKWYLTFLIFFVVGIIAVNYINNTRQVTSIAGTKSAVLSLLPKEAVLEKETALQLWVTADGPVTSVFTELSFDHTRIQMTGDTVVTDTRFNKIITQTPYRTANATGKLVIATEVNPQGDIPLPQGTFHLATLSFAAAAGTFERINIEISGMTKLTGPLSTAFTVTSVGSTLIRPIK